MSFLSLIHSAPVHSAILRACAMLTPAGQREEWLAEWRTELWYAWKAEEGETAGGRREITAFCLGAFRDALWLRRNTPLPRCYGSLLIAVRQSFPRPPAIVDSRLLESPFCCLAILAFFAAVCVGTGLCLSAVREAGYEFLGPAGFGMFAAVGLIVPVSTSVSPGQYRRNRHWARRWAFFVAKIVLLIPMVILGAEDVTSIGGSVSPFVVHLEFLGAFFAVRWALADQRLRCPVCLRLLDKPVRVGGRSRFFFEWNGTELMCLRGHGVMHVPEAPAICSARQQWLDMDASWSGMFRGTRP